MNISWEDKITNIEVLDRPGLPSLEIILIQMNLRWLGHPERMDNQRYSYARANAIRVYEG